MKFRGQVAGLSLDQPDLLVFDGGGNRRKPRQTQSEQNNSDRSVVHQDVTQPSKCELTVLTISLSHTSTCCSSAARLRFLPIFLNLDSAWLHPLLRRPWVGVLPVAVLAAFPHPPSFSSFTWLDIRRGGPSRFAWSFSMFLRFSCLCCWALGFWKAPGDSLGHNFINKIGSESVVNKYNNIHWNLTERFGFPSLSVPPEFNEAWFGSGGSSAADHVIVP